MTEEIMAANADVVDVATSEGIATPQETPVESTLHESNVAEVTQTQAFAYRLKEATEQARTKALDEFIAAEGYQYNGKPITTYAEYQHAQSEVEAEKQREQFRQENGFDPDSVKPLFEQWKQTDPDFQELKSIRAEKNVSKALTDLNNELKDAGVDIQLKDLSEGEVQKIPNVDKVTELVKRGHSLADAFFLANKKDIISRQAQTAQQETIQKITANGQSSPGSLGGGGESGDKSIYSMSKTDFAKMQEEVLRGERKKL